MHTLWLPTVEIGKWSVSQNVAENGRWKRNQSIVDLVRIPPSKDSLVSHIQRANYQTAILKHATKSIIVAPRPYDKNQGWMKTEEGIEPVWSLGPIIPQALVDILSQKEDDANADATDDREILANEELDEVDNID